MNLLYSVRDHCPIKVPALQGCLSHWDAWFVRRETCLRECCSFQRVCLFLEKCLLCIRKVSVLQRCHVPPKDECLEMFWA